MSVLDRDIGLVAGLRNRFGAPGVARLIALTVTFRGSFGNSARVGADLPQGGRVVAHQPLLDDPIRDHLAVGDCRDPGAAHRGVADQRLVTEVSRAAADLVRAVEHPWRVLAPHDVLGQDEAIRVAGE